VVIWDWRIAKSNTRKRDPAHIKIRDDDRTRPQRVTMHHDITRMTEG
jgi:uncharacterized protein YbaA (DUF1428 family)